MIELSQWTSKDDLSLINYHEQAWSATVCERCGGYPNLEHIWVPMDERLRELSCNSQVMDGRTGADYSHAIWLMNGVFVEQRAQTLGNRRRFTNRGAAQPPKRVADYGGGFGSLTRIVGEACPDAQVEIIEPHPHPLAIARADRTVNVRYRSALDGDYDILIATDIFEHVPDPLALVAETAAALKPGGW